MPTLYSMVSETGNRNQIIERCKIRFWLVRWIDPRSIEHNYVCYQLLPSTTIHSILPVQITCLAIFLRNLFPYPLWSTSWSEALHLIFHTFLYPVSVFFSQHMPIPGLCYTVHGEVCIASVVRLRLVTLHVMCW